MPLLFDGKPKGYAWVLFERVEDAQRCFESQKDIMIGNRLIYMNVSTSK